MTAPQLTVYIQGQGVVAADGLNTFQSSCDTFSQLRAFIGAIGVQVSARGQTSVNDGLGGVFYWNAAGTGPDDDLNNIVPSGAAVGCWTRLTTSSSSSGLLTASSMANLRSASLTSQNVGSIIFLEGYYNPADGGEDPFYISNVNPGADNGGSIIHSNTVGIYLIRLTTEPLTPLKFGCVGNNVTNDTTNWNNWLAAIAGGFGHIPLPGTAYYLPNGFSLTSHSYTKITCDPGATIRANLGANAAFMTLDSCKFCEVDLGLCQVGGTIGSGLILVKIISSSPSAVNNKIFIANGQGPGRQVVKPATPTTTNNTYGVYLQGPSVGSANYYNVIKRGSFFTGFDTGIAFHTPSGGTMNANANDAIGVRLEQFWFGCYTNSVENQFRDCRFNNAPGTDGSHLTECFVFGDGTYSTNFNRASGVAEPGSNSQGAHCLASSLNNKIQIEDNCDHSPTDAGSNDLDIHGQLLFHSIPAFLSGFNNGTAGAPSIFGGTPTSGISFPGGIPTISGAVAASATVLDIKSSTAGAETAVFYGADAGGANVANTAMILGKNNGTSRSLNAGGTLNASGADYAEYEFCGSLVIPKGAIVGFKTDGTLTLTFSEAVRFGIKSTNPNLVGGDTWGSEEKIGASPSDSDKVALAAWQANYEVIRKQWDRIAYAGKVPCNVTGALPGQFIIAVAAGDGSITGSAVAAPTFEQYRAACIGKVNRLLEDGRAEVAVMV